MSSGLVEAVNDAVAGVADLSVPRAWNNLAIEVYVLAEELHPVVVLELVDGLERPVVSRKVKVSIDDRTVLPVGRKPRHGHVQQILFVKQLVGRPYLNVERVRRQCDIERSVAVRHLDEVQDDVRTLLHVPAKIVR